MTIELKRPQQWLAWKVCCVPWVCDDAEVAKPESLSAIYKHYVVTYITFYNHDICDTGLCTSDTLLTIITSIHKQQVDYKRALHTP